MKKCFTVLFATMLFFLINSEAFAAETTVITPQAIRAASSANMGVQPQQRALPEGLSKEQILQMEQRRDAFEKHINLTLEQREKIKAIKLQARHDMDKIAADAAKKIDAVYTPEQRAKIAAEKASALQTKNNKK